MPPAAKLTTGSFPGRSDLTDQVEGGPVVTSGRHQLRLVHGRQRSQLVGHCSHVTDRFDDIAGARLPLGSDHRRAFTDASQGFAQIAGPTDERGGERPFVDVVFLVGRCEHFGFVDVVDTQGLEHRCLGEMTDPALGHDRDRHRGLDLFDLGRVRHPSDTTVLANVRWDPFQGHHRDGACLFGDLCLIGGDDIHDDSALEHLGEASLDAICTGFHFSRLHWGNSDCTGSPSLP